MPGAATGANPLERAVWTLIVLLFLAFAIAVPVVIARERSAAGTTGAAKSPATGATVVMANLAFSPTTLAVAKGAEVLFKNQDVAPHTVTARSGRTDSGVIGPGQQFRLVVNDPIEYFCTIHPSMTAKIVFAG